MAPHDVKGARKARMARVWSAFVAIATTISSLSAIPVSNGVVSCPVEASSREHGCEQGFGSEAPRSSTSRSGFHNGKLGRMWMASQSPGHQAFVLGRSNLGRNDGGKGSEGFDVEDEERSSTRSHQGSSRSSSQRRTHGSGSRVDWAKRRTTDTSSGFGSSRCFVECSYSREGHGGRDQSSGEAHGSNIERNQRQGAPIYTSSKDFSRSGTYVSKLGASKSIAHEFSRSKQFRRGTPSDGRDDEDDGSSRDAISRHDEPGASTCDDNDLSKHGSWFWRKRRADDRGRVRPAAAEKAKPGGRVHGGRDCPAERRGSEGQRSRDLRLRGAEQSTCLLGEHAEPELPFKLKEKVKPPQWQLISQAWERHLADKKRASMTKEQVAKVLESDWKSEMETFMNEAFVTTVAFPTSKRLVTEVFTTSQRVHEAAHRRGHMTGTPVSLETGYDLTKPRDQERALQQLDEEDPFFLVLAFPCGFWSPLMNLNGPKNYKQRLKEALTLVKFAFKMAERQLARGRHVLLGNPAGSRAWKLPWVIRKLKELNLKLVKFDQCRFNLRSLNGFLHKKPTYFATSSQAVYSKFVDKKCKRNHVHDLVFGGQKTSRRAGLYTLTMARAMVEAMEEQFEMDGRREVEVLVHEAMAVGDDNDAASDIQVEDESGGAGVQFIADDSDSDVELKDEDEIKVSAAVKQAVKRIHESTGHRSNKRLARALSISNAPPEVILAAKHLKCDVCDERRQPKARRPASLPVPKDTSDQCHIDLLVVNDAAEKKYVICHITDFTSRYQMAGILQSKATAEVISFLKQH